MRLLSAARFAAAMALCLLANTARATEYTFALPPDLPGYRFLCDVEAISPQTRELVTHFLYDRAPTPLADGQAIDSSNRVPPYTAKVELRNGVRTLVVDGPVDNVFDVRAGFCAPVDAGADALPYVNISGRLEGGSPQEENRDGYYDGSVNIWVDFCDAAEAFDVSQDIEAAFRQAAEMHPNVQFGRKVFDTDDKLKLASVAFHLVGHTPSIQTFGERVAPLLAPIGKFSLTYGERTILASSCEGDGLWARVLDGDQTLWSDHYSGFRLIADRQKDGNIFITFVAGNDTVVLNLFGVPETGWAPVVAAPAPENDDRDPARITYGIVAYGGTTAQPNLVSSVEGTLWVTGAAAAPGSKLTGWFDFSAVDRESGAPRRVVGGFRNLAPR